MSATATSVGYKQKLLRVSELQTANRKSLHLRVKLLVEIFEDSDFRADHGGEDDFQMAEYLDAYLEDTALTFLEARAVLDKFPDARTWQEKTIREMFAEANHTKSETDVPRRTRRSVTVKELEAAQAETKEYSARLKFAESNLDRAQSEIAELREENRQLVVENAKLEGRIVELERRTGVAV